jgi:CDP-diacylglycerol--glycerol-3-phosphate 3-phosphatidyltransferase
MISVYQFKPRFQQLLLPILNQLHKQHITANKITLAAIVWSAFIGVLLFASTNHPFYLLCVAFGLLVRMALNALDGMMARNFNQQSKLGEVLNELGDVVSDTIIFSALFSFSYADNILVFLFIVLSIINEFAGVLAKLISGTRRYDGPMGKSDRALFIGLWCLMYFIFPTIGFVFNSLLFLSIVLLLISTYKRLSNSL